MLLHIIPGVLQDQDNSSQTILREAKLWCGWPKQWGPDCSQPPALWVSFCFTFEGKQSLLCCACRFDPNEKNKHKFMVQSMFAPDGEINQDTLVCCFLFLFLETEIILRNGIYPSRQKLSFETCLWWNCCSGRRLTRMTWWTASCAACLLCLLPR